MTGTLLNLEKDFIASAIRALINRLQDVLSAIEEGETQLRQIRRFCAAG